VTGLYVAGTAGEPLESRSQVEVRAGLGVVGDRYTRRTGHWSDPRWPDQQLTLVEAETADDLGLAPGLLRRNVVTRGVRLDDLVGRHFRIGAVRVLGVRPCDPCRYLEHLLGRPGLRDALEGRGGLRAETLSDGWIAVGDPVS